MPELEDHKELINDFFTFFSNRSEALKELPEWSRYSLFCTAADYITGADPELAKKFARDYLKVKYNEIKNAGQTSFLS